MKGAERFEVIETFMTIPFFKNWNSDNIMSFYRELEHKFMRKGKVAYDLGDPADYFYILMEGEVQVKVMFELETIKKRPYDNKLTEWEIKSENMVHKHKHFKAPSIFGYKEIVMGTDRVTRANFLTDAFVFVGHKDILQRCKFLPLVPFHRHPKRGIPQAQARAGRLLCI